MVKAGTLMIVLAASVTLAGCGDKSAGTAGADAIGIPVCDDFLARYAACVNDKIPAQARPAFEQSLQATRDGWKQVLSTPNGRDTLEAVCKQVKESTAATVQAYGCSL